MSDPIGAIASRLGALQGGGISGRPEGGLARGLSGGIDGPDGAKRYTFDIGKGDGAAGTGAPSFGDTLTKAITQVSEAQDASTDMVQRFMRGDPVELHQVMAASEEAGIALEVMIELRNKVTEAYRTLMNMQS